MYQAIISQMKENGIRFLDGADEETIKRIEETYHITLPSSMRELLKEGIPYSGENRSFPVWTDFSPENQETIRKWLKEPLEWLRSDVRKNGYWNVAWGKEANFAVFEEPVQTAPTLIPICGHRYLVAVEGMDNPPVISAVGRDIIYYGCDLKEYLENEFTEKQFHVSMGKIKSIPFWGDLILPQAGKENKK